MILNSSADIYVWNNLLPRSREGNGVVSEGIMPLPLEFRAYAATSAYQPADLHTADCVRTRSAFTLPIKYQVASEVVSPNGSERSFELISSLDGVIGISSCSRWLNVWLAGIPTACCLIHPNNS